MGVTVTPEFVHKIEVDASVIDANGHANNVAFVQWMQDAAIAHSDAVGGTEMTRRLNMTWVVRRHTIEYRLPVYRGERIEVRTTVVDCRRVSSRRKYEFVRDGNVVARGETDWVLIDLGTLGPVQIPGEMMRLWGAVPDRE